MRSLVAFILMANCRRSGFAGRAISSSAPIAFRTIHSMLDWPEATQTSPTTTSETVSLFLPATVISNGPGAESFRFRASIHLPAASALAVAEMPLSDTVTSSPGSALPQIGTFAAFSRTMWSEMMAGSLMSAHAQLVETAAATARRMINGVFMECIKSFSRQVVSRLLAALMGEGDSARGAHIRRKQTRHAVDRPTSRRSGSSRRPY